MSDWKAIETAPKDGSEIILGNSDDSYAGYWEAKENYWNEIGWHEEDARQGHFYHRHPHKPTHWQPYPDPPHHCPRCGEPNPEQLDRDGCRDPECPERY